MIPTKGNTRIVEHTIKKWVDKSRSELVSLLYKKDDFFKNEFELTSYKKDKTKLCYFKKSDHKYLSSISYFPLLKVGVVDGNGLCIQIEADGFRTEQYVVDGLPSGKYTEKNKQKYLVEGNYKEGKKSGVWTYYYIVKNMKKANVSLIEKYEDDVLRESKEYYVNGKVFSEKFYDVKGEEDGTWKSFFDSGVLSVKKNYKSGTPVGVWIYFDESGAFTQEQFFDNKGKVIKVIFPK